ncbi:unnamed protein product [Rhodiola kirilowii]
MSSVSVETFPVDNMLDLEVSGQVERTNWVLNAPKPPGICSELAYAIRENAFPCGNKILSLCKEPQLKNVLSFLEGVFPIIQLCRNYKVSKFKHDLMAGLTLASLCIPQSIGYATLAKLDPQYGLYTSVVPPLIYALVGTSREIAIGPVAVVSLLISSMVQKLQDPLVDPTYYRKLVFTATLFAGVFQAAFGLLRLGFLVDFLSHAAIVGFMAGAAVMIGLQQLKGLLGISHFTNKTDIVSVLEAVWKSLHHPWSPFNFIIGCSFLSFILITRFVGRRNKKLFWLPAMAPLISVILSTLIVYLTRADGHGVKIVKHVKGGLNPSSADQLLLNGPHLGEVAKIGLVIAVVALMEAVAVGRSFAAIKGYHLDGNKEMTAIGLMNIIGSLTSCYAATGSFSRTAVNFSAGCETVVSNIVMAVTVFISLQCFTRLLYYTPIAILASIILSALPGLIDINEAYNIWKIDKLDFLACTGAFLGVLFGSVEIGLMVAVIISFARILLIAIQPGAEALGVLPGTDMYFNVEQYPMARQTPGVLIIRVKSALLCFANANSVRERIVKCATHKVETRTDNEKTDARIQLVVLDMSSLLNIDTSGITSLKELQKELASQGIELGLANPRWQVIDKLKLANYVEEVDNRIFLTVREALDACLIPKMAVV